MRIYINKSRGEEILSLIQKYGNPKYIVVNTDTIISEILDMIDIIRVEQNLQLTDEDIVHKLMKIREHNLKYAELDRTKEIVWFIVEDKFVQFISQLLTGNTEEDTFIP